MALKSDERQPLLNGHPSNHQNGHSQEQEQESEVLSFSDSDPENPRNWSLRAKYLQTLQITFLALTCPMASSITSPAVSEIQPSFPNTSRQSIGAGQAVFVMMLGVGPLFLAPMSETFGRRPIFLICLAVFTLLQIPTGAGAEC